MLYSWDWVLDFVKACAKMAVIWVISTILAIVLDSCGIRAENLLLVYLLGVLISILATRQPGLGPVRGHCLYLYVQLSLYGAKAYLPYG